MNVVVTDEMRKEIISKTRRMTFQQVANLLNISYSTVSKVMCESNPHEPKVYQRSTLTLQTKKAIAIEYFIDGLSQKALIDKYGLTRSEFYIIRKKYESEFGKKKTGVVTKTAPIVKEMLIKGKKTREIIEATGVSKQYVSQVRHKMGIGK